jgi:hypothetical protein
MREILLSIAPYVIPATAVPLALSLVLLVAGICVRKPFQKFFLDTSFAFVVVAFVVGCFGVAVTLLTIKEMVAGGS